MDNRVVRKLYLEKEVRQGQVGSMSCIFMIGLLLLSCLPVWAIDTSLQQALKSIADKPLRACLQSALEKQNLVTIADFTQLKCHNKGVVKLDGLDAFTGLSSLSLFRNNIKRADLRPFKALTHVNLASNELNQLQIAGLEKLETLFLFKNRLSTLDLTGLSALSKIRLMQNRLIALDITNLGSLKEAYLWDNQLEDLQITGLQNLTFLDVKQNPMPDELYDFYDQQTGITISHDGNADDWK